MPEPDITLVRPTPISWRRAWAIALDTLRHLLPLVPFYFMQGNTTSYLLLTAFDLALGLVLIVGTTRAAQDPTTVDPRAALLVSRLAAMLMLSIFLGIVAAFLTIPLGMPAFIFGLAMNVDWSALVTRPGFYNSAIVMVLMTGVRAQFSFESVTEIGERGTSPHAAAVVGDLEQDRRRSKAAYAAQVTLIASYVALTYALSIFGAGGLWIVPALFAGLLVFYDARPDIGQQIFPELWREASVRKPKKTSKLGNRAARRRKR